MNKTFTQEELNLIFEKWEPPNNWSYQQIAELMGVTRLTIARVIGKAFPDEGMSGEYNSMHVLTSDDVRKMRQLYASSDMSYRDIADEFGVSKSTCMRAIKKESWRGVE